MNVEGAGVTVMALLYSNFLSVCISMDDDLAQGLDGWSHALRLELCSSSPRISCHDVLFGTVCPGKLDKTKWTRTMALDKFCLIFRNTI